ncbi:MAG: site-specific DNA-methyltransferase [Dehalococcoidia bacterium]
MQVLDQYHGAGWALYCGDAAEVLAGLPEASAHLAVFSPPFSDVYTYSASDRDLGNVRDAAEFFKHFGFVTRELRRVMVPGRVVAMHTYEIQLYGTSDGRRARYDFPGDCIRHMETQGFDYMARITINKNPQTQAIRNHPQELLFATLRRDASKSFPAQADYLLLFRARGKNPIPIPAPITEEEWIRDAAPVWLDIRETDILPDAGSRENDDERHLCPLQLPVIERCVRIWSNPGETVLDPFAGIGSTGYRAVQLDRRFVGIELKAAYARVAARFLRQAEADGRQPDIFSYAAAQEAAS